MQCIYAQLFESVGRLLGDNIEMKNADNPNSTTICSVCSAPTPDIKYFLSGLQPQVQKLWSAYRTAPVTIDYSDRYIRAAYMLAYYPLYIDPVKSLLTQINYTVEEELSITFLGGGPLPELVGIGKYLGRDSGCHKINATILDTTPHWETEREYCSKPLAANFFSGSITVNSSLSNLFSETFSIENKSINSANLLIMQNCINEADGNGHTNLMKNLKSIWQQIKAGGYFLIIDLKYTVVRQFITNFLANLDNANLIIAPRLRSVNSDLPNCEILNSKLFDPTQPGLIPRRTHREYYVAAIKKTN